MISLRKLWNKINLVKRIRLLKEDNERLKLQLMNRRKLVEELKETVMKLMSEMETYVNEKDKALSDLQELIVRRDEVVKRLRSEIPDEVIGSRNMADYKFWIAEPLIDPNYKPYKPKRNDEMFVDSISAVYKIGEFIKKAKDKTEDDKKAN